ncbi:hypothetical protein PG984_011852 [Apiospora sp. TS-2023a]
MVCSVIITEFKGVDAPHHQSYITLLRSLEAGCYICNRLWATLTSEEWRLAYNQSTVDRPYPLNYGALEDAATTTELQEPPDKVPITKLRLEGGPHRVGKLYTILLDLSEWPRTNLGRSLEFLMQNLNDTEELAPDTKAAITRSFAINWIEDCLANHPNCNIRRGQTSWYPTRLLDCGDQDDPSTQFYLVETKPTTMQGPYMTLSHRWGPNPNDYLQLTTKNYRQLLDGIEVEALPQLYRDAIYVTRQLGIRYLWIDSLCIVQQGDDGYADLQRELPQMSEIYSHSFCNISAAETSGAHQSLFYSRDPRSMSPAIVRLPTSGHASPFLVSYRNLWEWDVSHSLINMRAWVLQERLLSPRVIHFGTQQLFWECCTKDAAEIYPDGMPTKGYPSVDRIKNLAPNCIVGAKTSPDKIASYEAWASIVKRYTACSLTFSSDKLVALSGIAKAVRSILDDEYIAGMWRRYLERELLWISGLGPGPDDPATPDIPYRAPSWSWAAIDGDVWPGNVHVLDSSMRIRVEDVQLQYESEDRTGRICGGSLKLSGVLKQLVLLPRTSPTGSPTRSWEMVVNGTGVKFYDASAMPHEQAEVDFQVFLDRPRHTTPSSRTGIEGQSTGGMGTLYGMPAMVEDWSYGFIHMLLLEVVDGKKGIFRRIGMAWAWGTGMKAKIVGQGIHAGEDKFPSGASYEA